MPGELPQHAGTVPGGSDTLSSAERGPLAGGDDDGGGGTAAGGGAACVTGGEVTVTVLVAAGGGAELQAASATVAIAMTIARLIRNRFHRDRLAQT